MHNAHTPITDDQTTRLSTDVPPEVEADTRLSLASILPPQRPASSQPGPAEPAPWPLDTDPDWTLLLAIIDTPDTPERPSRGAGGRPD